MVESLIAAILTAVLAGVAAGAIVSIIQMTNALTVYLNLIGLRPKLQQLEEFENLSDLVAYLLVKNPKMAELLVCPFCLATWVSLPFALVMAASFWWFLVVWPATIGVAVAVRLMFDGAYTEAFMEPYQGKAPEEPKESK